MLWNRRPAPGPFQHKHQSGGPAVRSCLQVMYRLLWQFFEALNLHHASGLLKRKPDFLGGYNSERSVGAKSRELGWRIFPAYADDMDAMWEDIQTRADDLMERRLRRD